MAKGKGFFPRRSGPRLGGTTYFKYNPHSSETPLLRHPTENEVKSAIKESKFSFASEELKNLSYYDIITIDPGSVNLGVYVERWWSNGVDELVAYELYKPLKEKTNYYPDLLAAGDEFIKNFFGRFLKCHFIVIESQLLINVAAFSLMQHIISSLLIVMKDDGMHPLIFELNPNLKTKNLGAPREVKTKADRKKWCVLKAASILRDRNEEELAITIFETRSKSGRGKCKKDDIADGVCMARVCKTLFDEAGFLAIRKRKGVRK